MSKMRRSRSQIYGRYLWSVIFRSALSVLMHHVIFNYIWRNSGCTGCGRRGVWYFNDRTTVVYVRATARRVEGGHWITCGEDG